MAHIRRRPHAGIAPLHHLQNVGRVPDLVVRLSRPFWVIVNAELDIEFLDQLFQQVHLFDGGFRGDGSQAQFFGEDKNLARARLIPGNVNDAKTDRDDAVFSKLVLEFLNRFIRDVLVQLDLPVFLAQHLARIKFNDLAAGGGGFFDGLKRGEAVKGISLATERESIGSRFAGRIVNRGNS